MCVNETPKRDPVSLPARGFGQQILVLTDQHSIQLAHPIQQIRIIQFHCTVQLRCEHIEVSQQETTRDSSGHVHVHVEANAHANLPMARNLFLIGDSPWLARNCSTPSTLRWISSSSCALCSW